MQVTVYVPIAKSPLLCTCPIYSLLIRNFFKNKPLCDLECQGLQISLLDHPYIMLHLLKTITSSIQKCNRIVVIILRTAIKPIKKRLKKPRILRLLLTMDKRQLQISSPVEALDQVINPKKHEVFGNLGCPNWHIFC